MLTSLKYRNISPKHLLYQRIKELSLPQYVAPDKKEKIIRWDDENDIGDNL